MATIYLETSFISACVTNRRDPKSIYRHEVSLEWWETQRGDRILYLSAEVRDELSHPNFRCSTEALSLAQGVQVLPISEDVLGLAKLLSSAGRVKTLAFRRRL